MKSIDKEIKSLIKTFLTKEQKKNQKIFQNIYFTKKSNFGSKKYEKQKISFISYGSYSIGRFFTELKTGTLTFDIILWDLTQWFLCQYDT